MPTLCNNHDCIFINTVIYVLLIIILIIIRDSDITNTFVKITLK